MMLMLNRDQLQRWLAREIHGRPTPSRLRRPSPGKRGPARNWKYKAWIRTLPCACCGREPAGEAAHTGDHAIGQKASDYSTIPLCTDCHTLAPHSYHRLGRQEFERRHGLDIADLVERLTWLWWNQWKTAAGAEPAEDPQLRFEF